MGTILRPPGMRPDPIQHRRFRGGDFLQWGRDEARECGRSWGGFGRGQAAVHSFGTHLDGFRQTLQHHQCRPDRSNPPIQAPDRSIKCHISAWCRRRLLRIARAHRPLAERGVKIAEPGDDRRVRRMQRGIFVPKIISGQCKLPLDHDLAVDRALTLEAGLAVVVRHQRHLELELPARLDEAPVLDHLGFLQDDHAVGEILHVTDQPGPGLGQSLEHEHARHDRETRKMVRQILLGQREILGGDEGLAGLQLGDAIDKDESHGGPRNRSATISVHREPRVKPGNSVFRNAMASRTL